MTDYHWSQDALCHGMASNIFFPPDREDVEGYDNWRAAVAECYRQAQKICKQCPVRVACLKENKDQPIGVWGGTTPGQRKRGTTYSYAPATTGAGFAISEPMRNAVREKHALGMSPAEIMADTGLSKASVYRICNAERYLYDVQYEPVRELLLSGFAREEISNKTGVTVDMIKRVALVMRRAGKLE